MNTAQLRVPLLTALFCAAAQLTASADTSTTEYVQAGCGFWTVTTTDTHGADANADTPAPGTIASALAESFAGTPKCESMTRDIRPLLSAEASANAVSTRTIISLFTALAPNCEGWAKISNLEAKAEGNVYISSGGNVAVASVIEMTGSCSLGVSVSVTLDAAGTSVKDWEGTIQVGPVTIPLSQSLGATKSFGPKKDSKGPKEDCVDFVHTLMRGRSDSFARGDGDYLATAYGTSSATGTWICNLLYGSCMNGQVQYPNPDQTTPPGSGDDSVAD